MKEFCFIHFKFLPDIETIRVQCYGNNETEVAFNVYMTASFQLAELIRWTLCFTLKKLCKIQSTLLYGIQNIFLSLAYLLFKCSLNSNQYFILHLNAKIILGEKWNLLALCKRNQGHACITRAKGNTHDLLKYSKSTLTFLCWRWFYSYTLILDILTTKETQSFVDLSVFI